MILHLDLDAFFASCEEARTPALKGKPVIIGATGNRGVVSTANYEARKYGVKSAMPIVWARQRCPDGVFLGVDFRHYREISGKIFSFLSEEGLPMEQTSIDEGYMDISPLSQEEIDALINRIKQFMMLLGLTCSIGIGKNRMVAKMASEHQKPAGVTIVADTISFLHPMDIGKVPGIGPKTKEWLNKAGIKKIGDLTAFDEDELISRFGTSRGRWLYRVSKGEGNTIVGKEYERKSIGAERTFMEDVEDKEQVLARVAELAEKVYVKMKDRRFSSKTMMLKIRYQDFETHTVQKSSISSFSQRQEARSFAQSLVRPFLRNEKKIRLVGARFINLKKVLSSRLPQQRESQNASSFPKNAVLSKGSLGEDITR